MRHGASNRVRAEVRRRFSRQQISSRVSPSEASDIIGSFLEALGSPRALTVWLLYRAGEHRQLVELTCDPHLYESPEAFRTDYCATKLLSKCLGLSTGIDLKGVAVASALEAEERCRLTNLRLRSMRSGSVNSRLNCIFFTAQQKIASILGPVPKSFQDEGWSRGRTTSISGPLMSSVTKYRSRLDVTVNALSRARALLRDSHLWGAAALNADGPCSVLDRGFSIVSGNVMITVPKSAKTDRVICYEPTLNIRLQRNVGVYLQHRLKKFGVDLQDQSINQRRARVASLTGDLCTIDLRSASDTLAFELVVDLLPPDWVTLLDALRSKYTTWPDGSVRRNEKFSSMGNGFTFELESLIFYAIASSVSPGVSVYGDDIICPTTSYQAVVEALEGCGFSVNQAKSFSTSEFRESCGADYFRGLLVTPVYIRSIPRKTGDVIKIHNAIRRWCQSNPLLKYCRLLAEWRTSFPCPVGPQGASDELPYGDGHYHVDFDTAAPSLLHPERGWGVWGYSTFIPIYNGYSWLGSDLVDRPSGDYQPSMQFAVLAAATGPKRARSVWDQLADRRQFRYKKIRAATTSWPSLMWKA